MKGKFYVLMTTFLIILISVTVAAVIVSGQATEFIQYIDYKMTGEIKVDGDVFFLKENVDQMNWMYETFENEWAICYRLDTDESNLIYFKSLKSKNTRYNETSTSTRCPIYSDLLMHSHPSGYCVLSETDRNTTIHMNMSYMGIWCGVNKYVVYDKNFSLVEVGVI